MTKLQDQKSKRAEQILKLLSESMSQEEFIQAFEKVLEVVRDNKKANDRVLEGLKQDFKQKTSQLENVSRQEFAVLAKDLMRNVDTVLKGNDRKTLDIIEGLKREMQSFKASEQKVINEVIKQIPEPEKGEDADEEAIQKRIEEDLPKLGERIRDGLELLKEDERLDVKAIRGLEDLLKKVESKISSVGNGGGGGSFREHFIEIDLSGELNGVLTEFNIPAVYKIISVDLSSYPYGTLRKDTDYSYTNTTITFKSTIDASTQLSAGQICKITAIT